MRICWHSNPFSGTRFPFTTKADLRAAYPFGFFSVPMDEVRVTVELRPEAPAGDQPDGGRLAAALKDLIGISAQILVQPSGTLARSTGKACRVIDRR